MKPLRVTPVSLPELRRLAEEAQTRWPAQFASMEDYVVAAQEAMRASHELGQTAGDWLPALLARLEASENVARAAKAYREVMAEEKALLNLWAEGCRGADIDKRRLKLGPAIRKSVDALDAVVTAWVDPEVTR